VLQMLGVDLGPLSSLPEMVPVTPAEREEFLRLAEQHFRELNASFVPHVDWRRGYFEKIQSTPDLFLRWIVVSGERAGFILFGLEDHRFLPRKNGVIYELYIAPGHRRKGIAKACAKRAIQELQALAPSKIQLEVVEGNIAAVELWKSLGFGKVTDRFVLADASK
jgi:ribosomal protein S18 acetylase RimI-like enzyme